MWVFQLDLIDHVDTEVHVHGLVAQDVLELLGGTGHLVASAHGQNLGEAAVKEDAFQDAVISDQVLQQGFVCVDGARGEAWIVDFLGVLQCPRRFLCDGWHFVIHVEDLAFIHAQGLNAVLVCVGVNGFFECLAQ